MLTKAYPGWAIVDTATGGVWRDQEGMGWVDGNRTEAWDYNVALALEAADYGFDEVQFDYVRFPTDGNVHGAVYSQPNTYDNRVAAISGILGRRPRHCATRGVKVSADIFGYTSWVADDLGIGQHIEALAPYVDVLLADGLSVDLRQRAAGRRPEIPQRRRLPLRNRRQEHRTRGAPGDERSTRRSRSAPGSRTSRITRSTTARTRRRRSGARWTGRAMRGGRGWLLWDPAVQVHEGSACLRAAGLPAERARAGARPGLRRRRARGPARGPRVAAGARLSTRRRSTTWRTGQ